MTRTRLRIGTNVRLPERPDRPVGYVRHVVDMNGTICYVVAFPYRARDDVDWVVEGKTPYEVVEAQP